MNSKQRRTTQRMLNAFIKHIVKEMKIIIKDPKEAISRDSLIETINAWEKDNIK